MTAPVTIAIPGTPIGKGRPRHMRNGHTYTPERTRNAEAYVRMLAAQEMAGRAPFPGPVALTLRAIMPVPASWSKKKQAAALAGEILPTRKPDLSNVLKLVEDGLNGIVIVDDVQIVDQSVQKRYGPQPLCVVTIEPLAQPGHGRRHAAPV